MTGDGATQIKHVTIMAGWRGSAKAALIWGANLIPRNISTLYDIRPKRCIFRANSSANNELYRECTFFTVRMNDINDLAQLSQISRAWLLHLVDQTARSQCRFAQSA